MNFQNGRKKLTLLTFGCLAMIKAYCDGSTWVFLFAEIFRSFVQNSLKAFFANFSLSVFL